MPHLSAMIRSLIIWAGILFWPALYVLTSLTVVAQVALVLAAVLGMAMYGVSEMAPYDGQPQWRDE